MKTESSSFRLEKDTFADFKKHAKDQGLTTNSMINKIMKEYMEWGSKAPSIQIIPYPTKIVTELLKNHTEEQIRKIGHDHAKESFSENILLLKNEESVDAFLEFVKNWCDASDFPHSIKEKDGTTNVTIRHNHGKLFSILMDEIIKTSVETLTKKRAETKMMTNSVSFWI